eukprot:3502112-Alexandrium_andersonii.AAC.1
MACLLLHLQCVRRVMSASCRLVTHASMGRYILHWTGAGCACSFRTFEQCMQDAFLGTLGV